jgi:hypothetical protein
MVGKTESRKTQVGISESTDRKETRRDEKNERDRTHYD